MSGNIFKSLATVSGMTMVSRVLGFVRQILMAGIVGAGGNPVADAFWAAFRLPNMFRRLFAEGAFHAAFIPMFQGKRTADGDAEAKAFAEDVLIGLVFVLSILTALVEIFAPAAVYLLASGFEQDPEKFALTTFYTRITFPYLLMMSLVGLYSGILNSLGRFAASAAAPVLLNVVMIAALLLYAQSGVEVTGAAAAWSVTIGGVVQLLLVLFGAWRQGFLLKLRRPRLTPGIKRLIALGAPGFVSAGAVQINLIIGTNIASREPGAVSWLMNADQLYQLPLSVIGIALGVVLLPMLSARVKAGDEKGAARALNRSLELSSLLALPAAAAFMIMGEPICDALFRGLAGDALSLVGVHRSAFTAEDVAMTGLALAIFGAGLPAFVWHKIFSPAFYAREDTKTPMKYALISIATNAILSIALFPMIGFIAVAVATSVAAWLQVLLLAGKLWRLKLFSPGLKEFSRFARICAAVAGLSAFLIVALPHAPSLAAFAFGREWVVILALSAAGIVIYGALALLLGAARPSDYKTGAARR